MAFNSFINLQYINNLLKNTICSSTFLKTKRKPHRFSLCCFHFTFSETNCLQYAFICSLTCLNWVITSSSVPVALAGSGKL